MVLVVAISNPQHREMEVEIISSETIKPSSPTPPHLKTIELSLLDQISPFFYTPLLLFYPRTQGDLQTFEQISTQLKNSLSETLVYFYFLAGRIKDQLSINCNDEGILYNEARVNSSMFKILQHPKDEFITHLVPWQSLCIQPASMVQVAIQVNIFNCGGIAFGFQFLHTIIDAVTMISFLNTWTSLASKSCKKIEFPNFVASSIFPPIHLSPTKNVPPLIGTCYLKDGKRVGRRFVFDAAAIAKLKAKATSTCVTNPSRVQVVTALILKRCMAATKAISGSPRASMAHHVVNVRPRMMPPLPENLVGCLLSKATISLTSSDLEFYDLVASIRSAFGKINTKHVKSLQGHQRLEVLCETLQEAEKIFDWEKMDSYWFSSWCNMGFHRVDFGWGKPIWTTMISEKTFPPSSFVNACWLLDTREGDGVEANLLLEEKEMATLECDPEFLEFASPDFSIIV